MIRFSGTASAERRRALGLSHEQVAVAVRRSASAVRMYEVGAIDPPASVVVRLAEALGVLPGDLFVEEQD